MLAALGTVIITSISGIMYDSTYYNGFRGKRLGRKESKRPWFVKTGYRLRYCGTGSFAVESGR